MRSNWILILLGILITAMIADSFSLSQPEKYRTPAPAADCWRGAGIYQLSSDAKDSLVRYGRRLIQNTSYYLGPKGTVAPVSNGMNCQNCHLEAGTKPWGNNYGAVASTYPKFRERSGHIESMEKRVNDCLERSLNGKHIDSLGKEMRAIIAYFKWLGEDVPKGTKPKGTGIRDPAPLTVAADPLKGKTVYKATCERCHGKDGQGQPDVNNNGYVYPPLWGNHSYNTGAGLYRISKFAGYVQNNMPDPSNYHNPALTDEEAWNVAAYVNSQPRPVKDISMDWPDIKAKPADYPFGPYADTFSERQHKYGPFIAMKKK